MDNMNMVGESSSIDRSLFGMDNGIDRGLLPGFQDFVEPGYVEDLTEEERAKTVQGVTFSDRNAV